MISFLLLIVMIVLWGLSMRFMRGDKTLESTVCILLMMTVWGLQIYLVMGVEL